MKKIISFKSFNKKRLKWAISLNKDKQVKKLSKNLYISADKHNFCYLYNWHGEPMLQTPDDILTLQEIIFETKRIVNPLGEHTFDVVVRYIRYCP